MTFPTVPYPRDPRSEAEQIAAARAFLATVLKRRTVRDFARDPVPDAIIVAAIEAANSAPSGANMQPWRFLVVKDAATKARIREAAEKEEFENYNGRMPEDWLRALAPLQTDWRKEFLEVAPALIVVFKEDYGIAPDGSHVTHYYVNESVGIACGFLLAALNAAGVASLTHTPSPMGFLREILDRPKNEKPFLLIPIGYAVEGCRVPDIGKKSVGDVLIVK